MPHLTAIVLAAGASTRMGEENKLLLPFRGKPLICSVIEAVSASTVDDVVVVTGHQDRQIRDALDRYAIRVAYNPEFEEGMAASIRRGLIASSPETSGYVICLGDMPFITEETIQQLCDTFNEQSAPSIIVATSRGRRSHPLVVHHDFRDEMMQLTGDEGMRAILDAHAEKVVEVEVGDEILVSDIDTKEAYDVVRSR